LFVGRKGYCIRPGKKKHCRVLKNTGQETPGLKKALRGRGGDRGNLSYARTNI
jgi:hypothetical protein